MSERTETATTPTEAQRAALGDVLVKLATEFDLRAGHAYLRSRLPRGGVVVLSDAEADALAWALDDTPPENGSSRD